MSSLNSLDIYKFIYLKNALKEQDSQRLSKILSFDFIHELNLTDLYNIIEFKLFQQQQQDLKRSL